MEIELAKIQNKTQDDKYIKNYYYSKLVSIPTQKELINKFRVTPEYVKKEPTEKEESSNETKVICEKCGSEMKLRESQYGKFYGCKNFPKCKHTIKI